MADIPSILKEIGKGERVALAKLAVEHFEKSQRPYRIAIDAAIWNFQNQAGQGGKNPALRTLFYRLLKLLALPIQPVFVFDGKNKPLTKRGRTVSKYGTCIPNEMSKKLIDAFRFPHHTAPGEAEAECAMLQRSGLVDAVMSQDVDAIMFGSNVTLRDWSKESKHNKTATHVSILDRCRIKEISGLDPDGMILAALLSGGDYDEAGVAGFGPALACEAARAGFGEDLLNLIRTGDEAGIVEWRERLQYELEVNESGHFKTRHKSVKVPEDFPNKQILSYYMTPVVNPKAQLPALERKWQTVWESKIDVKALRNYVAETFDWCYKGGAWKFVRVMAPALLASDLIRGSTRLIESAHQITERRRHVTSDGIPELRVTVIPANVVALDLDAEEDSPGYIESLADEDDDGVGADAGDVIAEGSISLGLSNTRKSPAWLPHSPEKVWLAEALVIAGARVHVEEWDRLQSEHEAGRKKPTTRKIRNQKQPAKETLVRGMRTGAILNYTITSNGTNKESRQGTDTSIQSSIRTRTTVRVSSKLRTPTKQKTRHALDSSPNMQHYFKSTKNSSPVQSKQEVSDLFEKLSQVSEDVLGLEDTLVGEKHSRPSTSNSVVVAQEMASKSHKHFRKEKSHPTASTTSHSTLLAKTPPPKSSTSPGGFFKGQDAENTIVIALSPAEGEAAAVQISSIGDRPSHAGITENVTTRVSGGKKRSTKASMPVSPVGGSRVRTRRPIEDFFAPYIAAAQREKAAREKDESVLNLPVVPAEHSTGLVTAFAPSHIHAVPRESLPGAWKEIEADSSASSHNMSTAGPSASRLSLVDLTER